MKNYNKHKKIAYRKKNKTQQMPTPCKWKKGRMVRLWGHADGSNNNGITITLNATQYTIFINVATFDIDYNSDFLVKRVLKRPFVDKYLKYEDESRRCFTDVSTKKIKKIRQFGNLFFLKKMPKREKRTWLRVFGV